MRSERSLPFAFLEPEPAVTQAAGKVLAPRRLRAGGDQRGIQLLRHVKVVAVEPACRNAGPPGERLQLVI